MAKQSSLIEFHSANGAAFTERDGWLLPLHFGNSQAEYAAVRSGVGIIDLSHRGLLQLTGPDRAVFLQGMLSNDVQALNPFDGQYATILSQQGKVLADLRVLCSLNSYYLDFWEPLKDKIVAHLNRYLVADEVEIADRSAEYGMISLQGPRAEALLRTLVGAAELSGAPMAHAMVDVDAAKVCAVRQSYTGETGFDLIAPKAGLLNLARRLTENGKQFSAAWIGEEAQNILRVEAGVPRYGVDFGDDTLLLEVGIEHSVSFTKGCYLGQEIVERIRSRGHVNRKLAGLILDGAQPARAGDAIMSDGNNIGAITSAVRSPALGRQIALGYLGKDYWEPGTKIEVKGDGSVLAGTVTRLPFVATHDGGSPPS